MFDKNFLPLYFLQIFDCHKTVSFPCFTMYVLVWSVKCSRYVPILITYSFRLREGSFSLGSFFTGHVGFGVTTGGVTVVGRSCVEFLRPRWSVGQVPGAEGLRLMEGSDVRDPSTRSSSSPDRDSPMTTVIWAEFPTRTDVWSSSTATPSKVTIGTTDPRENYVRTFTAVFSVEGTDSTGIFVTPTKTRRCLSLSGPLLHVSPLERLR